MSNNTDINIKTSDDADADAQLYNNSLVDILRFRGGTPNIIRNNGDKNHISQANAFTVVDRLGQETGGWTWETLLDRADKIRHAIFVKTELSNRPFESGSGACVAHVFRKSEMLDFLTAFFGCQMAGMTVVPINTIDQFEEMAYILSHTKTELALTTERNYKVLASSLTGTAKSTTFSPTDALPPPLPEVAYIEYTKSPNGEFKDVAISHRTILAQSLGDYHGVYELIQNRPSASAFSSLSPTSSKENDTNRLEQLEAFLIDAVVIQPQLELDLAAKVLAPHGVTSTEQVVVPMLSLPEHGGMVLSMSDYLPFPSYADIIDFNFPRGQQQQLVHDGQHPHLREHSTASETGCHYLLDREALKTSWIEVLTTGQSAIDGGSEMDVVLVSTFGYPSPQATLAIVYPETTVLCLPNTVGELWVDSPSIPFGVWDLPKRSQSTFHALPLIGPISSSGATTVAPEIYDPVPAGFLRMGLMARLIEGRVVVFGHMEDRIQQDFHILAVAALEEGSNERGLRTDFVPRTLITECHYAIDLVNTVLNRIVGFKTWYALFQFFSRKEHVYLAKYQQELTLVPCLVLIRSLNTVFQCVINKEHVPVICTETPRYHQQADAIRLAKYVRQAMLDYHGLAPYCIAIAAPGSLPRTLRHGKSHIHPGVCRKMLESGQLTLGHLWTSVDDSLLNLPVGDDVAGGIWGPDALTAREAAISIQSRTTQYLSYDIAFQTFDDDRQQFQQQQLGSSKDSLTGGEEGGTKPLTFRKFGAKVVRIATYIEKRGGFHQGEKVVLLFRTGSIEFIATLYAVGSRSHPCFRSRTYKTPRRHYPPHGFLSELDFGGGTYLIGNNFTEDVIKMKPAQAQMKAYIGTRLNISKAPKIPTKNRRNLGAGVLVDWAMVEQSFSIPKQLSPAFLLSYHSYPSPILSPIRPSFPINLSFANNFLVISGSRPSLETIRILEDQLSPHSSTAPAPFSSLPHTSSLTRSGGSLERTRLNGMFGHLVNPFITTRVSMDIKPVRLHISLNALRRGLVEITTELDDPTGVWVEDSGIPVCGTTVTIVNPETSEICLSHEIGEVWVTSDANVQPYLGRTTDPDSDAMIDVAKIRFHATISPSTINDNGGCAGGDVQQRIQQQKQLGSKSYARTGEIGFLWNYATPGFNGGQPTSLLFVLGAIAETFEVQGLLHFPVDVEQTIESAHPNFSPAGSSFSFHIPLPI
ncbi:hypothetical protein BGW39_005825 [Mortierella sp. 14UC]|nr:hypothetical protein BGW39_005825 [Mortierella sp. 14UC]